MPPLPPPVCEWDAAILADDPACVKPPPPTCTHTLTWVNPTEDENGNTLALDALITATLYATLIPLVPQQYDWVEDVSPYSLTWIITGIEREGTWHYELTVSNEYGESLPGNTSRECIRE
ncbi:MAG: hypothetical protein V3S12_01270 [Acidiferrobacterales bacterium]